LDVDALNILTYLDLRRIKPGKQLLACSGSSIRIERKQQRVQPLISFSGLAEAFNVL